MCSISDLAICKISILYSNFCCWKIQGVHFIYQLLLFSFHLFSLTLFLLLCFIVGEEIADYDTLHNSIRREPFVCDSFADSNDSLPSSFSPESVPMGLCFHWCFNPTFFCFPTGSSTIVNCQLRNRNFHWRLHPRFNFCYHWEVHCFHLCLHWKVCFG